MEIKKNIDNINDDSIIKILFEESKNKNKQYIKKECYKNFSIYFYNNHITYFFKKNDDIINSFDNHQIIFNVSINNKKSLIDTILKLKNKINNDSFYNFSLKINQSI